MSVDVASDSVSTVPIIVTRPAAQLSDACYVSIMSVTMGTLGPADALDRLVAPFNIPRGLYLAYFWHARDWTNVLSAGGVRAAVVKELANESMFAWVRQAFVKDFAGVVLRVKHAGLAIVLGARAEGNEMSHEREQVCRHVASWLDDGGRALLGSIDLAALGRSKQQEMLRGLYEYADDAQAWGTSQDAAIDDVHLLLRARRMTRAVLEVRVRQAREARRDEGRVTTSRRAQRGTLSVQAFRKSRVFLLLSDRFAHVLPLPAGVTRRVQRALAPASEATAATPTRRPLRKARNVSSTTAARRRILPDDVWANVEPIFKKRPRGRVGIDDRSVLAFVLLVLESGAQWESAPSRMTLWRRLRAWKADGIWHRVVGVLRAMPAYDGFEFDRVRTTVR